MKESFYYATEVSSSEDYENIANKIYKMGYSWNSTTHIKFNDYNFPMILFINKEIKRISWCNKSEYFVIKERTKHVLFTREAFLLKINPDIQLELEF